MEEEIIAYALRPGKHLVPFDPGKRLTKKGFFLVACLQMVGKTVLVVDEANLRDPMDLLYVLRANIPRIMPQDAARIGFVSMCHVSSGTYCENQHRKSGEPLISITTSSSLFDDVSPEVTEQVLEVLCSKSVLSQ